MDFSPNRRIVSAAVLALVAVSITLYFAHRHDFGFLELKAWVQDAPWWIFVVCMVALPPLAIPLSIFLVATGARFGLVHGSLIACGSIIAHHFIAACIHSLFTDRALHSSRGTRYWQSLEEKTGGNTSKLLFLWGLIPGCPYLVKLYLPLSMGAKPMEFARWCSLGHMIGAIVFVAFGKAIFKGPGLAVFIVAAIGIGLFIAFTIYRQRVTQSQSEPG